MMATLLAPVSEQTSASAGAGVHLGTAQEKLKIFNSRRKLKAHMLVARAAMKLGRLGASFRK